jgi:hypothetical protein
LGEVVAEAVSEKQNSGWLHRCDQDVRQDIDRYIKLEIFRADSEDGQKNFNQDKT